MKRSLLNAGLLILSLGLAAGVFFSQKQEEIKAPLTSLATETINNIVLEHPGKPTVRLEKQADQWKLTEPVQALADRIEVSGILSLASLATQSTLDLTQVNLAELGLDPPAYKVTLNNQVLEFGGNEPLQYRRYIKVGQGGSAKIALVDDPPSNALDADYSDLLVKALLPDSAEITKISLPGLSLTADAEGKNWGLTPNDPKAGADQKQKLADSWKSARAMWNAAESDEQAKADSKADTVIITLKDRELKFIIAERDPQLVLVRPDLKLRYTLSKELVEQLLQLPAVSNTEQPAKEAPAEQ